MLHQLVADFAFNFVDVGVVGVSGDFEQEFAGQRIAVGVQAIGRQASTMSQFPLFRR